MLDRPLPTADPLTGTADADAFKAAFRVHPTGVALIAATTPTGPVGLTASSVTSVSVEPLALAFSVTRATGSAGGILTADTFVVHLLAGRDVQLARDFARPGAPRFTPEQGWQTLPTGEPYLPSALHALRCRAATTTTVGTSTVVLAEVLSILTGPAGAPLVHHDRRYHALGDHSALD